MSVASKSTGIT